MRVILTWSFEPGIVIPLLALGGLYARGTMGAPRSATARQNACFWTGWAVLALALTSPLHAMGEALFSAHMAQHEILMLIAAPLLVLSRPVARLLHGLPFEWRRTAGRWSKASLVRGVWQRVTEPFAAWWIHAVALWVWHIPVLFQATLRNEWMHAAQHSSFFLSAVLFWWSLFYARGRSAYGTGVLYVFTTALHTGILGALLTLSGQPWYPAYTASTGAWGLTPLEDQQLGGLIMWVPASLVYLAAGMSLFGSWVRTSGAAAMALAAMVCGGCGEARGVAAVRRYGCGSCHTIPGVSGANGRVGPSLAGIGNQLYVAGQLANTPENLMEWVRHPTKVNEKTLMPDLGVTEQDGKDIAELLYSLK